MSNSTTKTPTKHTLMVACCLQRLAFDAAAAAKQADSRADAAKRLARKAYAMGDTELATDAGRTADDEAKEAAFFKRGRTAYTNALAYWERGIRPERLPSGAYILPSVVSGKTPHLVSKSGDWVCCCDAGASFHWPIAMLVALEIVGDEVEAFDDAPLLPFEPTARELLDTCDVCGAAKASVSITEGPERCRLCRPCFDAGWENNEKNLTSWAAMFDEAEAEARPMLDARAARLATVATDVAEWF